ncbi:MAG: NapC/NirT family cytochrome c [Leptothrix sp. (in: Bacteria)]|nr:NapC/NirT family cytochrome c [Leptothrix sp. (in: b-proteobacteria)]MBP7520685.1 NapC/NirT family cytochrome c [Leptothrix sp. (in: b-proteobacteria)]
MSEKQSNGLVALLRRPSSKYSVLTLLLVGVVFGVLFWGGFNTALEATNKEAFCISCHEMRENVYAEYKENTIHYTNRTGVRATCPDCHVPKEWGPKMLRKIQASREVWGKLTGTIDTREKFEAKRLKLAESEWARMKANQSLECRNCHSMDAMDAERQKPRAKKSHEMARKDGDTCIDCHKGIAHHKPQGMKEDDE